MSVHTSDKTHNIDFLSTGSWKVSSLSVLLGDAASEERLSDTTTARDQCTHRYTHTGTRLWAHTRTRVYVCLWYTRTHIADVRTHVKVHTHRYMLVYTHVHSYRYTHRF